MLKVLATAGWQQNLMGEFADYALEETFNEEEWRADNLPNGQPIDALFSWGTPDIESLKTDAFELAGMLEGAPGRFGQLQKSTQKVDSSAQFTTLRATAKKYQRTWHMRLGMAEQVVQGKTLSPKQIKWMSTNWIGGTTKFIKDFSGSKNTKILKALQKIVRQIDNLAN